MFGSKNKKNNNDQELATKINQDLVVRNMPSLARLNGTANSSPAAPAQLEGNTLSSFSRPKHNFKIVGMIIIFGGLIFIGGLVYLSYVYIIKPQINKNDTKIATTTPIKSSIVETPRATTTNQDNIITSNIIETVTPENVIISTSSTSSTMNEELAGKQNTNLPPLVDTDSDGLNDDEELILGTSPSSTDSNNNTYMDSVEISNNYDPAGSGKLSNNSNLAKQMNPAFFYEVLYPKNWLVKSMNSDSTFTFTAPDDSIIQISVQENTDRQSILGWYGNSFPDITVTYDKLKSTDNWDGIMGADNLNFYLTDKKKNNIYVFSYIPAVDGRLVYPNIFKLMINSLLIK